jgi:hypothetical protein
MRRFTFEINIVFKIIACERLQLRFYEQFFLRILSFYILQYTPPPNPHPHPHPAGMHLWFKHKFQVLLKMFFRLRWIS